MSFDDILQNVELALVRLKYSEKSSSDVQQAYNVKKTFGMHGRYTSCVRNIDINITWKIKSQLVLIARNE